MTAFQLFDSSPFGWLMPSIDPSREERERIGMALRQARKKAWGQYGSLARTAEMAGVSQGTLSAIERGDHAISKVQPKKLQNFPNAYGMSAGEFASLTGVTLVIPAEGQPQPANVRFQDNLHRVPVRTLAAAGNAFFDDGAIVDYEYVSADLYRMDMVVAEVVGESMEPDLVSGDRVYVDTRLIEPVEGRIVLALIVGNGYVVKRVRNLAGVLVLDSINPAHGAVLADEVQILGTAYHRQPRGNSLL